MTPPDTVTGMMLRLERTEARVSVKQLARRMGLHRASLHAYEGQAEVRPDIAHSYRRALASIVEERRAA